ncbi:MAG: HAD-IIIA family hydrolase [Flavobacteriaceae bacterium]|nr:HAD-IIIA family hydrolase [Flavobacteriaceae bacterium]
MEKSYKELMNGISTFILDVDGVLTDGIVRIMTNGEMIRNMNIKDGYAIKAAIDKGYNICIISGGKNNGVKIRLQGLGITDIYMGAHNKIDSFEEYMEIYELKPEEVLYMGDDIPDKPIMKLIGLPTCPNDAAVEIKSISKYISHKKGGDGCVRDVIEQVMRVQHKWGELSDAKFD